MSSPNPNSPPPGSLPHYPYDSVHDASGVIAVGGTAQQLFPQPVRGYEVHNPSATNDLWVCDNGQTAQANAAGSIRVAANGGDYWTPVHFPQLLQRVTIVGAVTGQPYTARYW